MVRLTHVLLAVILGSGSSAASARNIPQRPKHPAIPIVTYVADAATQTTGGAQGVAAADKNVSGKSVGKEVKGTVKAKPHGTKAIKPAPKKKGK